MTSASIGRQSAASCLNRLQRPFDAASARYRQTEDYRSAADLAPRPRQHPAQRTRRLRSRRGRCGARSRCSASAGRQQPEPVGPPSPPKAAPSPAVSLGLTAGAEVLACCWGPHHQVTPARPVRCTTSGPAGWTDSSPDDTPGQVRSGLDPRHDLVHDQDPSRISLVRSQGMRSDTAVQRRRAEAAAIEREP
jgi:hypothetical protein